MKTISTVMLVLLVASMLTLAFNIHSVEASGTIYIRADGSVEGTTLIQTTDNVTYVFVADIYDHIVIERDNIVIDGNAHKLQGNAVGQGICLYIRTNVTVKNTQIQTFKEGIFLEYSSNNTMSGNTVSNCTDGIKVFSSRANLVSANNVMGRDYGMWLAGGSSNVLSGNRIANARYYGIYVDSYTFANSIYDNIIENNLESGIYFAPDTYNNTVVGNNITRNTVGISVHYMSTSNVIFHNNFIENQGSAENYAGSANNNNTWDDGYPSGGNFWSDYSGIDSDKDGIGDAAYVIGEYNRDRYPLMNAIPEFPLFLILSLFMVTTLPAVIAYRTKRIVPHSTRCARAKCDIK